MVESSARLLSAALMATVAAYPTDQFAPTAAVGSLEAFYDKHEAVAALRPPAWHVASPQEVRAQPAAHPLLFVAELPI